MSKLRVTLVIEADAELFGVDDLVPEVYPDLLTLVKDAVKDDGFGGLFDVNETNVTRVDRLFKDPEEHHQARLKRVTELIRRRLREGKTQAELAERLRVSASTINRFVRGSRRSFSRRLVSDLDFKLRARW